MKQRKAFSCATKTNLKKKTDACKNVQKGDFQSKNMVA